MNKHTTGNDMADDRLDTNKYFSNPQSSPTPPQPNTGDERLREKIQQYVEAAYLHGLPVENLDTGDLEPPRDISDVAWITDAIMQAVKAELGAARLNEAELVMSLIEAEQLPAVRVRIAELRNHFGIGNTDA